VQLERSRRVPPVGERLARHHLADRSDGEPVVRLEHVEVVDVVPEVVAVLAHAHPWRLGHEPERRAVLAAAFERAQPELRVRLRDLDVVAERRRVLDPEPHRYCCCCCA
jgi:hypothetical protein